MAEISAAGDIRFLESVENLKRVVSAATGREMSTELAVQASACLQQGRLFLEAASTAAGEIRPLLLSYGTIAFAKATVLARTFTKLESLPQSHGLRDVSAANAMIKDLRVKIEGDGTFQRSVDTARSIERFSTLQNTRTVWVRTPSCDAKQLDGLELSLEDVLQRVGDLAAVFRETFSRDSASLTVVLNAHPTAPSVFSLQVDIPANTPPSARDLLSLLEDLKRRFPFLTRLSFSQAEFVWDHTRIMLDSSRPGGHFPTEVADIRVIDRGGQLLLFPEHPRGWEGGPIGEISEILPCGQGGLFGHFPTFTSPVGDNAYLSEITLLYLGTFLLGSLVRYRPQIWIHALYGAESTSRPRDDATRALIYEFLDAASSKVPRWCAAAIRAPALP